jgi:carbon-monoxide dehydrogenase large subunit
MGPTALAPVLVSGEWAHAGTKMTEQMRWGVGARLPRKEDDRYMRGRGTYVGDIKAPGLRDVAFVRSPVAHARVLGVNPPPGFEGRVFVWGDMDGVSPIRAVSGLPGFKPSDHFPLANGKVKFVGDIIAMCVGSSRADAEDLAAAVTYDLEELPVVPDALSALEQGAGRVHEDWSDNTYLATNIEKGDKSAIENAAVSVTRKLRLNRQCMAPLEGKGTIAWWDDRLGQLVVHTSTQLPHMIRRGLSECLGLEERQIHVVAPDVGGGFGFKSLMQPEEVCVAWLAMHLKRPVRWLEDRREHLVAAANTREHNYDITVHLDRQGRLLGIEADAIVDVGAYSVWPFSACLESAQIASILPGPYRMDYYACSTVSVATNKPPFMPYRGVARTGVCFALEVMLDIAASELGLEPHEVRAGSLVTAEDMPYTNITGKLFDSGDYPESLRRAVEAIDLPSVRERQKAGEKDGRLLGIGIATFAEQAAHGTTVYAAWGIPMVPGYEQASARVTPDGGLELRIGVHSHGQGMETTMAQVASEVLGLDPAVINVVHGDTALTPFSTGTWGSRCMVMAGGAVSRACGVLAERIATIGAHLLQTTPERVKVAEGRVTGEHGSVSIAEVAKAWYLRPEELPQDVAHEGLETTAGYKPKVDSGTFSYATHAAVVLVDPDLGGVEIVDYVVAEDGGTLVNPQVVDGQILGGTAQGIGTALYEESPFDTQGQPLASTFADYILPGPVEVPDVEIIHMEIPSPYTEYGVKGIGEGGAIAPPAAVVNAINDALKAIGAEVLETPASPRRIVAAIQKANAAAPEPSRTAEGVQG